MKNINIIVENKRATVVGSPMIICGNSDYTVTFTFDAEWTQSGARTARFVYVKGGEVQHEDVVFTGNTVAVPVLSDVTFVNVGVFEGDLCTTTPARVNCHPSILCGSGIVPAPTPDVYSQIMELFNELAAKGATGATEEQAQQIRQNKQDIEELAAGTKKAGDASKLEGHAASYFATAQSVTNLENGTTKAAKAKAADDASKLGGHGEDYFAPLEELAKYLLLTSYIPSEIKVNSSETLRTRNTSGVKNYTHYYGANVDLGYLGFSEANVPSFLTTGGIERILLHNGNMTDYLLRRDGVTKTVGATSDLNTFYSGVTVVHGGSVSNVPDGEWWLIVSGGQSDTAVQIAFALYNEHKAPMHRYCARSEWSEWKSLNDKWYFPTTGGTVAGGDTAVPMTLSRTNGDYVELGFNGSSGTVGYLGFSSVNEPVFENATRTASYKLHHDGNSAKVHIGTSAPSDTTALWIDTSA